MKVKTNLTPAELDLVSKGLSKLAEKQRSESVTFENNAEEELFRKADRLFETMIDNIQVDVSALLLGK